jgi:hypothetical protein
MHADIVLFEPLPADVEAEVSELFREVGASVRVRSVPTRRGLSEAQWLVLALIPLEAFLKPLVAKSAEDAYGRMRILLRRLSESSSGTPGEDQPLVLQDSLSRVRVVLEADLPAVAYRQLIGLDLSQFKYGPVHYDPAQSAWRSEIDEAQRQGRATEGPRP